MESLQDTLKRLGMSFVAASGGIAEYRLDANGLKILLVEDHNRPVVLVDILYRIGSRNEANGYTGSAHFFEHLMFKGTRDRHPKDGRGIDDLLKPVGAIYNANTWLDRTQYFELLPANQLELGLAIEFDRMRNLKVTTEDRNSEMTVVRSEFEIGENDPEELLDKLGWATAFTQHAYHWPTIGYRDDVENVPLSRMKGFYDTFYWPNNATCIVMGDFDPQQALALIHKYAGSLPASPAPIPDVYTHEPPQEGERRVELHRAGGSLPLVWLGFHIPNASHKDIYALTAAAQILGSSQRRNSRLYKRLIDSGLAAKVNAHAQENRDPSLFLVTATCGHGASADEVEKALLEEVARLAKEQVSESELARIKEANRKGTTLNKADILGYSRLIAEAEAVADWRWVVEYDDKFEAVTAGDIQRVARTYLQKDNRTVCRFVPKTEEGETEGQAAEQSAAAGAQSVSPSQGAEPRKATVASQVSREVLANGLTVVVMPLRGTGSVSVAGALRAGSYYAGEGKGLVPWLTSSMLVRGSSRYSKAAVAEALEKMGTDLRFGSDNFAVNFGTTVVSADLPEILDLVADVLRNPLLDPDELSSTKRLVGSQLRQRMTDTGALARSGLNQALYSPESVYYDTPYEALLTELEGIGSGDLKSFHAAQYSPRGTVLTVVGDVDPARAVELVKARFADWTGPEVPAVDESRLTKLAHRPSSSQSGRRIEIPVPDKTSVDIIIGLPALTKRSAADYYAAKLANDVLGHDTLAARLGKVVREQHGLTYGITSRFLDNRYVGAPWAINMSVNPDNVEKALKLTDEVVRAYIAGGVTDQELADEKGRATGEFQLQLRSSLGLARALANLESIGLTAEAIDDFERGINAVTKEQVNEAIRKFIRIDEAVTVLSGTLVDSGKTEPQA